MQLRLIEAFLATLLLSMVGCGGSTIGGGGIGGENNKEPTEHFDPTNFDRSTVIDNQWLPLKPGTRLVWEGTGVDDEGDEESRQVVFTVTDLTKEIGGVHTVVCWEKDIVDGELEEAEIVFFAQAKDGTVWHLGQYPEVYKDGQFSEAPCWIHGLEDAKAGIMMKAEPKLGAPSYSQGWGPKVNWTDRAVVYQMGQKVTVPFGSYEDVLVIDETDREEPNAHQLKYYTRGVGNIRVGWRGEDKTKEILELVKVEQLGADELAEARGEALKLEKRAYEISKDVYARTPPAKPLSER